MCGRPQPAAVGFAGRSCAVAFRAARAAGDDGLRAHRRSGRANVEEPAADRPLVVRCAGFRRAVSAARRLAAVPGRRCRRAPAGGAGDALLMVKRRRWLGGYTGDCLGAVQQVAEIALPRAACLLAGMILHLIRHSEPEVAPGLCYGRLDLPAKNVAAAAERLRAELPPGLAGVEQPACAAAANWPGCWPGADGRRPAGRDGFRRPGRFDRMPSRVPNSMPGPPMSPATRRPAANRRRSRSSGFCLSSRR